MVKINPNNRFTWEGWGTSLAWWAKEFGDRDDIADIFFTRKDVNYNGRTLPGLGLNVARYLAGASSFTAANGETMVTSAAARQNGYARLLEGYWLDWNSQDPTSASWNWGVDAKQRAMLIKARERGADKFELFSNSPMWWMLYNHNPSGADAPNTENLQSWNYDKHAIYLATVAWYARKLWGITFASVDPFNEPDGNWKADGAQEGSTLSPSTQAKIIPLLRQRLDERSLGGVTVSASDFFSYTAAKTTWEAFDGAVQSAVGRINVHGYDRDARRDLVYSVAKASGKGLWMSEYGDGYTDGMRLASAIHLDMRWLHPTAWVYWQVIDTANWGMIEWNGNAGGSLGDVVRKYYVFAQFTRHIRPGMQILDGDSSDGHDSIAAYDAARGVLVVVATNYGSAQWIDFELSDFGGRPGEGTLVRRWVTNADERYAYHEDTYIRGTRFWSWFNADTVQTFEVPGIRL